MGKVKNWAMSMQHDCWWMSRDAWAARHGSHNLHVYDDFVSTMKLMRLPDEEPDWKGDDT